MLAKTDAVDAAVIARFGLLTGPRTLEKPDETAEGLRELVVRRRQLVTARTAELNREKAAGCRRRPVAGSPAARALRSVRRMIEAFGAEIEEIDAAIAELIESDEDWRARLGRLKAVPGIGRTTAAALLAELPELGRLSKREVASLAGLAPFARDSGRQRGVRGIRGGRSGVRTALYMAAVSAIKCNPRIRDFSDRLKAAGKPGKVRVTACMRKLLTILNAIARDEAQWNPAGAAPMT